MKDGAWIHTHRMIDLQPTRPRAHASAEAPGEKIDTHSSPLLLHLPLSASHTPTLAQAVRARLSLHKQLFPRVTASTLSLFSVTSYKSLTPPLMIALQWSLKGTLPAKHTQTTHSLAPSFSPLCLSLLPLPGAPGASGIRGSQHKTALGLFELNI